MGHVPDHSPTAAAVEHATLIVALDAGDLAGSERDRAASLADTCAGCASLLADLAVIRAATAGLPAPTRTRDYRLTNADAARLRPSPWGRLVRWLGAPRSTVRPLAGALAALGIAGLLLSASSGLLGQAASTVSTAAAPVAAPGVASEAAGGPQVNDRLGSASGTTPGPGATAAPAPAAISAAGAAGATPGVPALPARSPAAVTLPAPSPAAGALPAPTVPPSAGVLIGPATATTEGPSRLSANAGSMGLAPKAALPEGSPAQRSAALPAASEPATPDRTVPLVISLALLAAGIGLLVANRALRRRARG